MLSDRAQILITAIDQTKQAFASVKGNQEGLMSAARSVNGVLAVPAATACQPDAAQ